MDKAAALAFLHAAKQLPGVSFSSIGRAVDVDPSHVSRIAAGGFVKLDGHALKVCKYAQVLVQAEAARLEGGAYSALADKLVFLAGVNPQAAQAVRDLIDALVAP
ncbi:MAG: hypothetical protein Q4F49_08575 [Pseudoxanthomonas suwonensis]|nr:hypothetical protein [Pseudoxanthomonas suwonensis]